MVTTKNLIQSITKHASEALYPLGFQRRTGQIFTREYSDELLGWIGLNHSTRNSEIIEVNPVVGVRSQQLERLLAKLMNEKPHSYNPPSIAVSLGYLVPNGSYRAWFFENVEQVPSGIANMADVIQKFGLSFMQTITTIERLGDALSSGNYGLPEQNTYRIPLAFCLTNQSRKAVEFSESYVRSLEGRTDAAAERYKKLHLRLLDLLVRTNSSI